MSLNGCLNNYYGRYENGRYGAIERNEVALHVVRWDSILNTLQGKKNVELLLWFTNMCKNERI